MWSTSFNKRFSVGLAALAAAVALAATCPSQALAAERIAHSTDAAGNVTYYSSVDEAVKACSVDVNGADGPTVVMDADWKVGKDSSHDAIHADGSITVEKGKKLTIDMCGHSIENENSPFWWRNSLPTFSVKDGGALTLTSSEKRTFSYKGLTGVSSNRSDLTVTTGGLVTNTSNTKSAFIVGKSSTLTLDGVAVAGCSADQELTSDNNYQNGYSVKYSMGGVTLGERATLNMKNGASVEHNGTGGVYTEEGGVTVNMDNASIHHNYAAGNGGGIRFCGGWGTVNMSNGASISNNVTNGSGGGIYFTKSQFNVVCTEGDAFISGNRSEGTTRSTRSGGGISVESMASGDDKGLIKGITISDNYSAWDGGGLELDQENTTVENCTITGNKCQCEGGGIFSDNDDNIVNGCTITGNVCNLKGTNYGGGGIFVSCTVNLKLAGTCLIYGNTRGENTGNADDVFLNENFGASAKAYVTGGVKKGSKIGIRTGIKNDRMIGEKINNETKDCFFADLDGYYVSYGTDHGGDMWQRHATKEFTVSVNGRAVGRYRNGSTVTVSGAAADASKAFARWDAGGTTGLYPFADYVADESSPTLTFKMPQNDVDLAAEYVGRTDSVALFVAMPTAGAELDESANLTWGDGEWAGVQVAWLVEGGDGWAPASGRAAWGATYKAVLAVGRGEALSHGLAFAASMDAGRQSVVAGATGVGAQSAAVDADGGLTLTSNEIRTAGPRVTSVEGASATVKAIDEEQDLRAALPSVALGTTDSGETVALKVERDDFDLRACGLVGDNGKVAYPEGGTKAVRIPVSSADGSVAVPDGTAVEVVVRVTQNGAGGGDGGVDTVPAAPVVTPDSGSYSVSGDAGSFNGAGQLVVGATCEQGASVVWEVRYKDPGDDGYRTLLEGAQGARVGLAAGEGGTRRYEVTAVAVRGGASSEPTKREYDVSGAAARKVTVRYADTAAEGRHGDRADDSYAVADGSGVTLVAPAREGYVFERWAGEGGETLGEGATLRLEKVEADTAVTAVYNPAVTEVDVSFAAPVAHGALASTATVRAKVGGMDEAVDITGQFVGGAGGAAVTWSPAAGADGAAAHETAYTASLTFGGGHAVTSDPKYVLPANATLKFGGNVVPGGAAWLADGEGGARLFCVAFPSTGPLEEPVVEAPRDVELTYERALAAQGGGAQAWGLPQTVSATCKCGESVELAVEWGQVAGFDASRAEAQELTVRGKVTFPDYVDSNGADGTPASDEVCVRVRVAAPKGGGGEEGETPVAPGGDEAGGKEGKAEEDGAGKAEGGGSGEPKALPATGDPGHPAAGALLAASAACLAAAAARHRSRR